MHRFTLSAFTGAIFDMDGTLLDSMPIWRTMGSSYIRSKGLIPDDNLDEVLYTLSITETGDYLNKRYNLGLDAQTTADQCNAFVEHRYKTSVTLKPGVQEFLYLLEKRGIPAAVATATDRYLVELVLERLHIARFFKGIVTSTEAGSAKAQSPAIFHLAAKLLGSPVEKTVVFEDALFAVQTAKKAGYPVAALFDESAAADRETIQKTADWYAFDFYAYADNNV